MTLGPGPPAQQYSPSSSYGQETGTGHSERTLGSLALLSLVWDGPILFLMHPETQVRTVLF